MIIAIDGHSSCGKSTLARQLARELGYLYIDSGAMYRAVTLAFMDQGLLDLDEPPTTTEPEYVGKSISRLDIGFGTPDQGGLRPVLLNGENVEQEIRTPEVAALVSFVSAWPSVRRFLVELQRRLSKGNNVVMDGRDIGTVVFPDAELKVFLTADPHIRAMRRQKELREKGRVEDLESVLANLRARDHLDSTRTDSPLKQAPDALLLDNSQLDQKEQLNWVLNKLRARMA